MSKKSIIIIVAIVVFLAIIIFGTIFYLRSGKNIFVQEIKTITPVVEEEPKTTEDFEILYNQQFPDVLRGTVNIISNAKTTLTTQDKKVYLISPARPMSYYEDAGIKNKDFVEIRGKLLENNMLSLGYIIPAK